MPNEVFEFIGISKNLQHASLDRSLDFFGVHPTVKYQRPSNNPELCVYHTRTRLEMKVAEVGEADVDRSISSNVIPWNPAPL